MNGWNYLKKYKIIVILCIYFVLPYGNLFHLQAQNDSIWSIDTNYNITVRTFDTTQLNEYANHPMFIYDLEPPSPSLLKQFWDWLFAESVKELDSSDVIDTWQFVRYLSVFLLVCLVIKLLLSAEVNPLFFRRTAPTITYEVLEENIHDIDFDQKIQLAIAQQEYRKAVRLYYLKTLKTLSDKTMIQWTADKTNQRYIYELQKSDLQQPFKELTYLFDYVWYGDFTLNADTFTTAQQQFVQFQQQIQQQA